MEPAKRKSACMRVTTENRSTPDSLTQNTITTSRPLSPLISGAWLVPAERDVTGPVPSLLDQGLVELTACPGVDGGPAVFTVVLEAGDIGAEEGSKLASTACALTLITQLVI